MATYTNSMEDTTQLRMDNNKLSSFWNTKIPKPVTCNLAVFPTWHQCEVLRAAKRTLSHSVERLSHLEQLSNEYFVLNRLVYMKHGQLRREKSYLGLKQIKACAKKFISLDLEKVMKGVHCEFENAILEEGIRTYLPSRQMWEHVLTQLLASAALLSSTASRCAHVFLHVHRHLTAGMLIPTNMLFLSSLSRIWACCQALCLDVQQWYQQLRPVIDVLTPTQVPWLPEGATLPDDMSIWLTQQGFTSSHDMHKRQMNEEDTLSALMAKFQHQPMTKGETEGEREGETEGEREGELTSLDDSQTQDVLSVNPSTVEPVRAGIGHPPQHTLLSFAGEEDFGAPVDISEVDVGSGDEDLTSPEPNNNIALSGKTSLKAKIMAAPTIRDLQLILRKFQKKCPANISKQKVKKCSNFLSDLQSRSQMLELKGKEVQGQMALGRKRLLKFFKTVTSKTKTGSACVKNSEQKSLTKIAKKKKKADQNLAKYEQSGCLITSNDVVSSKKDKKKGLNTDAKKQKKGKKSGGTKNIDSEMNLDSEAREQRNETKSAKRNMENVDGKIDETKKQRKEKKNGGTKNIDSEMNLDSEARKQTVETKTTKRKMMNTEYEMDEGNEVKKQKKEKKIKMDVNMENKHDIGGEVKKKKRKIKNAKLDKKVQPLMTIGKKSKNAEGGKRKKNDPVNKRSKVVKGKKKAARNI